MAYNPKHVAKDFVKEMARITENYIRNRVKQFKVVTALSVFLGRLDEADSISWERNMLSLYEDEIPRIYTELNQYFAENETAVTDVFPSLRLPIHNFFQENHFSYENEIDEHLQFESKQRNDILQALENVLRP